jgi:Uma2 family endonuclease
MVTAIAPYTVTWEKLPDDFVLDDEPVDNINQPPLAAALTESLELAGRLSDRALTTTNYGLCATLNQQIVVKAPDWGYVPQIQVSRQEVKRSYTPYLQGEPPVLVMEFISDTEGGEYSTKPTFPPGKWFFYEQILRIPSYAIFEPDTGTLELYRLDDAGRYQLQPADDNQRYWVTEMDLFLGVWQGTRENRTGPWLRWWDAEGNLLLWGAERVEQERQRAERLAAQLRAARIEPEV